MLPKWTDGLNLRLLLIGVAVLIAIFAGVKLRKLGPSLMVTIHLAFSALLTGMTTGLGIRAVLTGEPAMLQLFAKWSIFAVISTVFFVRSVKIFDQACLDQAEATAFEDRLAAAENDPAQQRVLTQEILRRIEDSTSELKAVRTCPNWLAWSALSIGAIIFIGATLSTFLGNRDRSEQSSMILLGGTSLILIAGGWANLGRRRQLNELSNTADQVIQTARKWAEKGEDPQS